MATAGCSAVGASQQVHRILDHTEGFGFVVPIVPVKITGKNLISNEKFCSIKYNKYPNIRWNGAGRREDEDKVNMSQRSGSLWQANTEKVVIPAELVLLEESLCQSELMELAEIARSVGMVDQLL